MRWGWGAAFSPLRPSLELVKDLAASSCLPFTSNDVGCEMTFVASGFLIVQVTILRAPEIWSSLVIGLYHFQCYLKEKVEVEGRACREAHAYQLSNSAKAVSEHRSRADVPCKTPGQHASPQMDQPRCTSGSVNSHGELLNRAGLYIMSVSVHESAII